MMSSMRSRVLHASVRRFDDVIAASHAVLAASNRTRLTVPNPSIGRHHRTGRTIPPTSHAPPAAQIIALGLQLRINHLLLQLGQQAAAAGRTGAL